MSRIHQEFSTLLQDRVTAESLARDLAAPGAWHPFPRIDDREGWTAIPASRRTSLIAAGETHAGREWPPLRATVFLEFVRTGNRNHYEEPHFGRRTALLDLIVAECVENQGRFLNDIIDGLWAVMEESFWGVSAHSYSERFGRGLPDTSWPVVDLFAAETGALLSWSLYLLEPVLGDVPQIPDRIRRDVTNRILDPYRSVDSWAWFNINAATGRPPNNWNPWIHSNIIACALLVDDDVDRRAATIHRALVGTDRFLAGYFADGGCDEGISYWGRAGASLFDCLDLLFRASDGKIAWWDVPLVREIGRYVTHAHIGGPWYVNFADGAAKPLPDAGVVYRYGMRIEDEALQAQGAEAARHSSGFGTRGDSFGRRLGSLFEPISDQAAASSPALERDTWLDGLEVLIAREHGGSNDGLFLAAKGGHNEESHNHLDVGQVIVGYGGVPYLIDVGVETYTRKTFSAERYDIWTMQSQYHNLPTINGHGQAVGYEARATDVTATLTGDRAGLILDLAEAYPEEAGITSWVRDVRLDRGRAASVTLTDSWVLEEEPQSLTLTLMSAFPVEVEASNDLLIRGSAGDLKIALGTADLLPVVESISIDDERLHPVWGDSLWRVVFTLANPPREGSWTLRAEAGP